jgi:phospholipid/cholesterol/gamma-HCH transport system permease protein
MQAEGMDRNDSKTGFFSWEQDQLTLALKGEWRKGRLPLTLDAVRSQARSAQTITLDAHALTGWDSGLLTFLLGLQAFCHAEGIDLRLDGLPEGIRRLLALTTPGITQTDAGRTVTRPALLERAGDRAISTWQSALAWVAFIGEAAIGIGGVLTGRVRLRRSDLWTIMYTSGAQALPIVSLVSFLVGLILAFIGAVQLAVFGAQIYVASLVGISMVRVMGAVMVGVVMSGRTGAAFAARLGTMQVNEEIDALVTFGFSPFDFLVLPRMIALVVMMPLLCLYADFMGIVGGLTVGVFMFDLSVMEYIDMTRESVRLQDFWVGLVHSAVFGIIIALAGCLRGMQCGRSASAVGDAATSAVVTAIVGIIVATAVITVLADILGI